MNFELGGITIPIAAGLEFSQTYESIGGSVIHRMQSGRAVKQTHFRKLRTVLSGQGWVPAGLDGLDYNEPLLLKCALPKSISSRSHQIAIPSNRRTDDGFEPKAYALVDGQLIVIPHAIKSDLISIDLLYHATSYQIHYYPEIMVFAEIPQVQGNLSGAEFSWSLTCEEL